jgi:hypothetical protein
MLSAPDVEISILNLFAVNNLAILLVWRDMLDVPGVGAFAAFGRKFCPATKARNYLVDIFAL